MRIRTAEAADAAVLAAIYGYHVIHGVGSFEERAPSPDEMAARLGEVRGRGLPYRVAEIEGRVAGFAYAAPFRLRAAYRYTVEDSVYISPDRLRRGVGEALLGAVIADCEAMGLHQMMALIGGGADNVGSIGLHRASGFTPAGVLKGLGFKAGGWVDVMIMQRALNGGVLAPPAREGLALTEGLTPAGR